MLMLLLLLLASGEKAGTERWDVKTLTDDCADKVYLTHPVHTTIHVLANSKPFCPKGNEPRGFGDGHEWLLYEVDGVVEVRKHEADGDIHLALKDPNDTQSTMIVEIPDPALLNKDHPHLGEISGARRVALTLHPGDEITVRGVGFYDKAHHQTGAAPSCFELHPVLWIRKK